MKKLTILMLCAVISGCSYLTPQMDAKQLEAASKTKDVNAVCITASGPWGKGQTTYLNVDRTVIKNGSVQVDDQCKLTFTNSEKAQSQ